MFYFATREKKNNNKTLTPSPETLLHFRRGQKARRSLKPTEIDISLQLGAQ